MYPTRMKRGLSKPNDNVMTMPWVGKLLDEHFQPGGDVMEPCCGDGTGILAHLSHASSVDYCETRYGINKDYFDYEGEYDYTVSNVPYSEFTIWQEKAFGESRNVLTIAPVAKVFSSMGYINMAREYGNIKEILILGSGSSVNFPFGWPVAAVHYQRGYTGKTLFSYYNHASGKVT
jgi:hypothetical protein